jgi:hypothetical protein
MSGMFLIVGLVLGLIFAVLSVEVAEKRGLSRVNAFFFGLLFGPIGLISTLLWPGLAYDFQSKGKPMYARSAALSYRTLLRSAGTAKPNSIDRRSTGVRRSRQCGCARICCTYISASNFRIVFGRTPRRRPSSVADDPASSSLGTETILASVKRLFFTRVLDPRAGTHSSNW